MKTAKLATLGMALGLLMAAYAVAQDERQTTLFPAHPMTYDGYYAASQEDKATPPAAEKATDKKADAAKEEEEKGDEEEKAPEPHRLIGKLGCTDINVYGWLDAGGTANADNPASALQRDTGAERSKRVPVQPSSTW